MVRSSILLLFLAGLAPTTRSAPAADARPWFQRLLVGIEVGPTGAQFGGDGQEDLGYATRFNGRDIVRACVDAHSEYLVIWARDGEFAYYQSETQPGPPGMKGRDVLRETMDEARKHDLPVIAYCVLQYPSHALREHPDWRMQDHKGEPINGRVCFNSPYRDHIKALLKEMLAYGIDGFHLDMVDQGFGPPHGCWCDRCQKLFLKTYEHPMPNGITWDRAWDHMLEFKYNTSEQFEKDLTAYIRRINPNATVDYNYHGNPPFAWEVGQRPVQHANNADFVTGETGVWGFSALGVGLNAEFYRAASPGLPFQVAIQRGVRMYHDQTTRPLNDIRWELLTLLAHGAFVTMIDKTAFDGGLDPVAYNRIGQAFSEAQAKRPHFGQPPLFEVGVYYSARSRDWIGRDDPQRWMTSFTGAQQALVMEHIPYGVLHQENLSLPALRAFPVVWLPNAGILSEDELRLLRQFVEEGGNLILTGHPGQFDRLGNPLNQTSVSRLIGARPVRRLHADDNWFRFPSADTPPELVRTANALRGDIPADWPFLVKGPATVYEANAAQSVGVLMQPHRTLLQRQGKHGTEWPMSADTPVGPAVLLNQLGKGMVLTFAGSPDFATASEHALVENRKLVRQAARFLHPNPIVNVKAPANVEAIVTDDPLTRTLRIHLLAYHPTPRTTPAKNRPYVLPGLIEDTPIYRVTVQSTHPVKSARALDSKTTLEHPSNHRVEATVENLHEVLLLQY